MIRVNLVRHSKKKAPVAAASSMPSAPTNLLPIVLAGIFVASAAFGYVWYATLASEGADLVERIGQAEAQRAQLEAVIKQDAIYEARKKALENRINVIEGLQRNQISPIVSLDMLGLAVDRTQYVWLSNVDQNNTTFSMAGIGTSVNALADFVSNLESTGHFRNINLVNAQDASGNYTFAMTCEFLPPQIAAGAQQPETITGGN